LPETSGQPAEVTVLSPQPPGVTGSTGPFTEGLVTQDQLV
jgi:hypothetical protein